MDGKTFFRAYQATALNTIPFNNDSPALLFISCMIFFFKESKTGTHSLPLTLTWSIPRATLSMEETPAISFPPTKFQ